MGLFQFFWDASQDRRIRDTQAGVGTTATTLVSVRAELDELRTAVDRLALVNQALWELVREQTDLTDAELSERVALVDARDGRVDGRMGPTVAACDRCQRPNSTSRTRCLYCGAQL